MSERDLSGVNVIISLRARCAEVEESVDIGLSYLCKGVDVFNLDAFGSSKPPVDCIARNLEPASGQFLCAEVFKNEFLKSHVQKFGCIVNDTTLAVP